MVVMEPFRSIPELERIMQYAHRHEGWDVMVQPEGEPLVGGAVSTSDSLCSRCQHLCPFHENFRSFV